MSGHAPAHAESHPAAHSTHTSAPSGTPGFFEERGDGFMDGLKQFGKGTRDLIVDVITRPFKYLGNVGTAVYDGVFSRDRGILGGLFKGKSYKEEPWKNEAILNPMRLVRRAVAGVLETGSVAVSGLAGVFLGERMEQNLYGAITGIGKLPSIVIGKYDHYLGERKEGALDETHDDHDDHSHGGHDAHGHDDDHGGGH